MFGQVLPETGGVWQSDRQIARFTGRRTAGWCGAALLLDCVRRDGVTRHILPLRSLRSLLAARPAPLAQSHCSVSQICGGRCRAHSAPRTGLCCAGYLALCSWDRMGAATPPPGEPDNPLLCCAGQRNRNWEPRPRPPCQHAARWGEKFSFYSTDQTGVSCGTAVSPGRWCRAAAGDLVIAITPPAVVQTGHHMSQLLLHCTPQYSTQLSELNQVSVSHWREARTQRSRNTEPTLI